MYVKILNGTDVIQLINVDKIVSLEKTPNSNCIIHLSDGGKVNCNEPFDVIKIRIITAETAKRN